MAQHPAGEPQVLGHGQRREDALAARHERQAELGDLLGGQRRDVLAVEDHLALVGRQQAGDGLEQGRLAGAVGAEQGHHLVLADAGVDAEEHLQRAVGGLDPVRGEQRPAAVGGGHGVARRRLRVAPAGAGAGRGAGGRRRRAGRRGRSRPGTPGSPRAPAARRPRRGGGRPAGRARREASGPRGRPAAGRWTGRRQGAGRRAPAPARCPTGPRRGRDRGRSRRGRACGWATGSSTRWGRARAGGPRPSRRTRRRSRGAPAPSRAPARRGPSRWRSGRRRRRPHAAAAGPEGPPWPKRSRSMWPGPPRAGPHPPTGAGRSVVSMPSAGVSQSPTSTTAGGGSGWSYSSTVSNCSTRLMPRAGDRPGVGVAQPLGRLPQAAGDHHEDGEEAHAGEQQLELGERVAQPLDQGDAGQRAAERGHAADDGHREHQQAVGRLVGVEPDAAQGDGVDRPGQAGEDAREHEGHEPGLDGVDAGGGGRPVVVAGRGDDPPGPRPAQVGHHDQRRHQQRQRQRVEPALVDQLAHPEDLGPGVRRGQQRLVVGRVEEVELHGHGEGERGHGQELAGHPQRRQAEQQRDGPARGARQQQGDEQVEVVVGDEVGGDDAAHADDGHLPEADDAAPAGEHHQRHGHHPVDERDGDVVDLGGAADERHDHHEQGQQRAQHPLRHPDLGEAGELGRQGVARADYGPRRLLGAAPRLGAERPLQRAGRPR